MSYLGDRVLGSLVVFNFTTSVNGVPTTLSGSPAISVYKNSTTESTAGVTITVDYDSRTGMNHVVVDTSADAAFYANGNDFSVVVTTGTLGGISMVGYVVGEFSIGESTSASSIVSSKLAQGGATDSITLASTESSVNGTYDPAMVRIVGGTGVGQSRMILDYNGTTKVATVDRDWRTNPDATSVYQIISATNLLSTNEGIAAGGSSTTITLNANALSTDHTYEGLTVVLRGGTGQDQARLITGYVGSTKVATVSPAWATAPDATSIYIMLPTGTANINDIGGSAVDATSLAATVKAVGRGTATTGGSTTSVTTSALSIGGAAATGVVANQFSGRAVLFDGDTTTTGLRGASSTISASSASNTPTLTVGTLPATPASGDTFSII